MDRLQKTREWYVLLECYRRICEPDKLPAGRPLALSDILDRIESRAEDMTNIEQWTH